MTPIPYQPTSETSRLAAESIAPHAATIRARILEYLRLRRQHGATRDEIEADLEISGNTVRPRCRELEEMGLAVNSGRRRETRSGRAAAVYIATDPTRQIELEV